MGKDGYRFSDGIAREAATLAAVLGVLALLVVLAACAVVLGAVL